MQKMWGFRLLMKTKKQIEDKIEKLGRTPKSYENEAGWWTRTKWKEALEWVLE